MQSRLRVLLLSLSECLAPKAREGFNFIGLAVGPFAHNFGRQETVNKVHRVKSLSGWLHQAHVGTSGTLWEKDARGGSGLPSKVARRLLLLRSLRDSWVLLGLRVDFFVRTLPLTLSIAIAGFLDLSLLPC
jgi:hypothetical protein